MSSQPLRSALNHDAILDALEEGGFREDRPVPVGFLRRYTRLAAYLERRLTLLDAAPEDDDLSRDALREARQLASERPPSLRGAVRQTSTGTTLAIAGPREEVPPTFAEMAGAQAAEARALGERDLSGCPRWAWPDLANLVGPMLPGDLWVVGALTGNGKTAIMLSQMQFLAEHKMSTLYLPLELDPAHLRRLWAAWHLGLEWSHVARNEWDRLPEGSQDALAETLHELAANPYVHFPEDRRPTLARVSQWVDRAVSEAGARVVIVDHFHRLDFGPAGANYRVQVTDTARALKDLARQHQVAILIAAQLNTDASPLDRHSPPLLRRLKESSGISEESDGVLMLSRQLNRTVGPSDVHLLNQGQANIRDMETPNVMVVTCRKHRLDDRARDARVRLYVRNGHVESYASWGAP